MKTSLSLYLWLFRTNLFISAFTFGGGYVVVPMVRKYFVEKKQLFGEEELMEMAAISQSSPGAIAINLAALSGYRAAGRIGFFIACVSSLLPPLILLSVISLCYSAVISNSLVNAVLKGMQAGVAALIVDFIADMIGVIRKEKSIFLDFLVVISFSFSFFTEINVIFVLVGCCFACIVKALADQKGGGR